MRKYSLLIVLLSMLCLACGSKKTDTSKKEISFDSLSNQAKAIYEDCSSRCLTHTEVLSLDAFTDTLVRWRNSCEDVDTILLARVMTGLLSNSLLNKSVATDDQEIYNKIEEKFEEINFKFFEHLEDDGTLTIYNIVAFVRTDIAEFYGPTVDFSFSFNPNTGQLIDILAILPNIYSFEEPPHFSLAFSNSTDGSYEICDSIVNFRYAKDEEGWFCKCTDDCLEKFLSNRVVFIKCEDANGRKDDLLINLGWFKKQYGEMNCEHQ